MLALTTNIRLSDYLCWNRSASLPTRLTDGATPRAIVDTQQSASYFKAAGYWLNAWQGRKYITKGLTVIP